MSIHSQNDAIILEFGLKKPAFRIVVNSPTTHGSTGMSTGLDPSMTLGCGGYGGNITSDNISPRHLLNIKRLYTRSDPCRTGLKQGSGGAEPLALRRAGGPTLVGSELLGLSGAPASAATRSPVRRLPAAVGARQSSARRGSQGRAAGPEAARRFARRRPTMIKAGRNWRLRSAIVTPAARSRRTAPRVHRRPWGGDNPAIAEPVGLTVDPAASNADSPSHRCGGPGPPPGNTDLR